MIISRPSSNTELLTKYRNLDADIRRAMEENKGGGVSEKQEFLNRVLKLSKEAQNLFQDTIVQDPPSGPHQRLFDRTGAISSNLSSLETAKESEQRDLRILERGTEMAVKTASKRLRCQRRQLFATLEKVLECSACVLAIAAIILLCTGVGSIAAPIVAGAATAASAGAAVAKELKSG